MGFRKQRPRRKVCQFCKSKQDTVDYKDVELLKRFVSANGRIIPRRVTGNCAKHQRVVAQAVKRARIMALIPFVEEKK